MNGNADIPNLENFIVPRIDAEHRAYANHVVSVGFRVFNVFVSNRHTCKQLKVFRGLLP